MASTSTHRTAVPEREAERVEKPSTERPAPRQPEIKPRKFSIKLSCSIPG